MNFIDRVFNYFVPAVLAFVIFYIIFYLFLNLNILPVEIPLFIVNNIKLIDYIGGFLIFIAVAFPIPLATFFIFSIGISYGLTFFEKKFYKRASRTKFFIVRIITYFLLTPIYLLINFPLVMIVVGQLGS